tara:strand:+ start:514 stop:654 length:141 start_codon:yes stop_codon:yes gene_type:complete
MEIESKITRTEMAVVRLWENANIIHDRIRAKEPWNLESALETRINE